MSKLITKMSGGPLLATVLTIGGISPSLLAETGMVSQSPLTTAVAAVVSAQQGSEFANADRRYRESVQSAGDVSPLLKELRKQLSDTKRGADERARTSLQLSLVLWRSGDLKGAIDVVTQGLDLKGISQPNMAVLHEQLGRLLEAQSDHKGALGEYRQALALASRDDQQHIQQRIAVLTGDADLLLELAKGADQVTANRIAAVLALMGEPGLGIQVFQIDPSASKQDELDGHLRLADWALLAEQWPLAQQHAWAAVNLADNDRDSGYSLGVLVEAYRASDSLEKLVEELQARKTLSGLEKQELTNLLRELGRPGDALEMLLASERRLTAAQKRQLINLYLEAGRDSELQSMLAERMQAKPSDIDWPAGLCQYHLSNGNQTLARQVWLDFIERNRSAEILILAAEEMETFGFVDLAVQAAEKAQLDDEFVMTAGLFQFDLLMASSNRDKAERVLDDLSKKIPESHSGRKSLVDSYLQLDKRDKALKLLTSFVEQNPKDVSARIYLAEVAQMNGEHARARDLLLELLPLVSATQLNMIESRLLKSVDALGQLPELTAELTEKVNKGTAGKPELGLLVRIQANALKPEEGIRAIEAYYRHHQGAGSVEALKEKASLYQQVADFNGFDRVTRELITADPANALDHVRGTIINYIENLSLEVKDETQVAQELEKLAALHARYSKDQADREFEAGILEMVGQYDRAKAMYEEVLARHPERSENYIALGEVLKYQKQQNKARALYQYLAESADSEALVVLALDGLMTLQPTAETVAWAERQLMLRLLQDAEKSGYYRVMVDMAASAGNSALQMNTLVNILTIGRDLRGVTLEELAQLTNPQLNPPLMPDPEKYLNYIRRLLIMGHQLPPKNYLNMGAALMSMGDSDAALQAVNLAVEQTGDQGMLERAGELFTAGGRDDLARVMFQRALNGYSSNYELNMKLAAIDERVGNLAGARQGYLKALLSLMAEQPAQVRMISAQSSDGKFSRASDGQLLQWATETNVPDLNNDGRMSEAYRALYLPLRDGLVRTLQNGNDRRDVIAQLQETYQAAMEAANSGRPLKMLSNYPQLEMISKLLRYVLLQGESFEVLSELDLSLLKRFPEDKVLPQAIVIWRQRWGVPAWEQTLAKYRSQLSAEQIQLLSKKWQRIEGADSGNGNVQKSLLVAQADGDKKAITEICQKMIDSGAYRQAMQVARNHLSERENTELLDRIISQLQQDDSKLIRVLTKGRNGEPSLLAELESSSGQSLLSEQQLLTLIGNRDALMRNGDWDYLFPKLSSQGQVVWVKAIERLQDLNITDALHFALSSPLDEPAQKELFRVYRGIAKAVNSDWATLQLGLYTVDIDPNNIALAEQFIDTYMKLNRVRDNLFEPNILRLKGQVDAALDSFLNLYFNADFKFGVKNPFRMNISPSLFLKKYQNILLAPNSQKLLAKLSGIKLDTADQENLRMELLLSQIENLSGQFLESQLKQALQSAPESNRLRRQLLQYYLEQGRGADAVDIAGPLVSAGALWEEQRDALKAVLEKLDYPEMLQAIVELEREVGGNVGAGSSQRSRFGYMIKSFMPAERLYRVLSGGTDEAIMREARKLWQQVNLCGQKNKENELINLDQLRLLSVGESEISVLDALLRHPVSLVLLNDWYESIQVEAVRDYPWFADMFAVAIQRYGDVEERFVDLSERLKQSQASNKTLYLWLALASSDSNLVQLPVVDSALINQVQNHSALNYERRNQLAIILSHRGKHKESERIFTALVMDLMTGRPGFGEPLQVLSARVQALLPSVELNRFVDRMLLFAKPWLDEQQPFYDLFVLNLLKQSQDPVDFYKRHRVLVDGAFETAVQSKDPEFNRLAIQQLRVLGQDNRALEALLQLLRNSDKDFYQELSLDVNRYRRQLMSDGSDESARSTGSVFELRSESSEADLKKDWPKTVLSATIMWQQNGQLSAELAVETLLKLAKHYPDLAGDIVKPLQLMYSLSGVSAKLKAGIAKLSEQYGRPLSRKQRKEIMVLGATDMSQATELLREVRQEEGLEAALDIGQRLARFSRQDEMMTTLVEFAREAGDSQLVAQWLQLKDKASQMRL
ncbi:hypothetical protein QP938_02075 [Porticoccaceae bacterium LTM1]|nr:hypothetical protein QP938_02075 [Porticoccaceae bacterium LTM1]